MEIIQKFEDNQLSIHQSEIEDVYLEIQRQFFDPLKDVIENIRLELKSFEDKISNIRKQLQ